MHENDESFRQAFGSKKVQFFTRRIAVGNICFLMGPTLSESMRALFPDRGIAIAPRNVIGVVQGVFPVDAGAVHIRDLPIQFRDRFRGEA